MASEQIGILGGIFDPIHNGHLAAASLARQFLGLQKIIFIPSGNPPHKNAVTASAHDRLEMLRAALVDQPWGVIWDREILREGYSYTIDTLHELRAEYPDSRLYFLVGSDNLSEIPTWRRYPEIIALVTLCVSHRPCYPLEPPAALRDASIVEVPSPEWGVSSTMVRSYLRKGYDCRYLMPDRVLDYIQKNGLYHSGELTSGNSR